MTTRLDRLFLLLDTGSTPLIRKSAAEQLGEVQKLHPYELNNLLSKVHGYLCSQSWETRIAAGQAVEAICRNVPKFEPKICIKQESLEPATSEVTGKLLFSQFDLRKVLVHGTSLLSTEEKQFELGEEFSGLDDKEKLSRQRQMLNKKLGLDMAGSLKLGLDGDLFSDEDLKSGLSTSCDNTIKQEKTCVSEIIKQQLMDVTSGMSARERNRAKRRTKLLAKQRSRDVQSEQLSFDAEPPLKKSRSLAEGDTNSNGKLNVEIKEEKLIIENNADNTLNMEEVEEWPFESFSEMLMNDLFHSSWETRHGAATGLRDVIKYHGNTAGMSVDTPQDQLTGINQFWLSDVSLRLLCVMALDRFGDFVSDEVVAPVRESCAQCLGVLIKFLNAPEVEGVVMVLLQLLSQSQWEVRHGGLLGFKYLLAVRQDMTEIILPTILPSLFCGIQDISDDVRAVAAAALVPVANSLITLMPLQVPLIVSCLWETLLDLDDLTSSTNSIMTLLSTMLSHPQSSILNWLTTPLTELVPRLWPFLRHNITSVRKSALETFYTLLTVETPQHPTSAWLPFILSDALRHIYQRSLLEENLDVLSVVIKVWSKLLMKVPLEHLLSQATPWLGVWLSQCMQPSNIPFDPVYMLSAKHRVRPEGARNQMCQIPQPSPRTDINKDYIAGMLTLNASVLERDTAVLKARMTSAKLLGMLCDFITRDVPDFPSGPEKPVDSIAKLFIFHLNNKSAVQRFVIGQVTYEWANASQNCTCPESVTTKLMECLCESLYYDEIAVSFTHMQSDCKDFISALKQQGVDLDVYYPPGNILTVEQASALTTSVYEEIRSNLRPKVHQTFEDRRKQLQKMVEQTTKELQTLTLRVQCSLSKAVVELNNLPEKMNPVVRPLMECMKKEENIDLQFEAAESLCHLIKKCLTRNPNPSVKVVKNLHGFLCCDPTFTPLVENPQADITDGVEVKCTKTSGILTLTKHQKATDVGRRWLRKTPSVKLDLGVSPELAEDKAEIQKQHQIQRRGGDVALSKMCRLFGDHLGTELPTLWEAITSPLEKLEKDITEEIPTDIAQETVNSLQLIEAVGSSLDSSLIEQIKQKLSSILNGLKNSYTAIRHMSARSVGMMAQILTSHTLSFIMDKILPLMGDMEHEKHRQGACEALACVIDVMGMDLLPYIVLLVVPILGRMSDQNEAVRLMATHCFATLIRLMPLEAGVPDPPEMEARLTAEKEKQRQFLEQLMDSSKLESYKVAIPVDAELRKYQQDGVNWLAFLNKYSLHGILCDDMGLGKTLQSICILASDHFLRDQKYQNTKGPDCVPMPSIVVCPPTLIGHWVYEVNKFVDVKYLNPLMYAGPPGERTRLQKKVKKHNLIVASYDVVRNDIDFFGSIKWNYCVLDEGHVIKNGKTKLSKAVKQLTCNHRLILSGTPIQNNVLDLWSLFDFLMPGFLGTEKQFQARYGKPILQSRDAKSTSKEQEAGALAMESLHRQVLPFILRRLKEDVLQDLPPKIIQDYYCDLSPLQVQLYEDFAKSRAKQGLDDVVTQLGGEEDTQKQSPSIGHVFQALQYLKKVCNHPSLVLTPNHPKYKEITLQLKQQNSNLRDLQHTPKLMALRQLLNDCGIGVSSFSGTSGQAALSEGPVVGQHRVLLFCQLKSMLEIVENDLLKTHMPSVTYLRLDGSVPANNRHNIVNRFNNDPSIDILLLTTHVGGLGLNLTGADTVIFVEHDWNPMKDLQAMDRAHRIGQKKVVNVYRLITRGTLEEKIMGLQKFKMTIANTVISQENASLQSMGTDQLLDLFSLDEKNKGEKIAGSSQGDKWNRKESMQTVIESLGELWDESQYEKEYSLDNFMESLK
ncbi:TATA-binding protein-associated factor 172-like [Mytilus californianus]|uniref:TATA-binding protein-associated factor 172-like n=1 Tax=Mytilus californianus TaxID=6549 RepID=UPI0022486D54|nr:TATA-binding protein-associated factor 172-like [Mytilus californianus]